MDLSKFTPNKKNIEGSCSLRVTLNFVVKLYSLRIVQIDISISMIFVHINEQLRASYLILGCNPVYTSGQPFSQALLVDSPLLSYIDVATFSIYVVRPDGFDLRRIHVAGSEGLDDVDRERINHMCFSEDGEWLLFTANLGGVTATKLRSLTCTTLMSGLNLFPFATYRNVDWLVHT